MSNTFDHSKSPFDDITIFQMAKKNILKGLNEAAPAFPTDKREQDEEEMFLLCSTMDERSSKRACFVQKSPANSNIARQKENNHTSILSTELVKRMEHVFSRQLKVAKPKANSSPRLLSRSNLHQSMTFNVDYASTPKKNQPRASTPSRIPTTTMTRSLPPKKTIPPPLLSSSVLPSPKIKRKRCSECCPCCSKDNFHCSRMVIGSFGTSGRKSKKPRRRISIKNKSNINCHFYPNSHLSKYPIRFMLNRKAQDIDRCDPIDEALTVCDLKPILKNCYALGDYNVWIL